MKSFRQYLITLTEAFSPKVKQQIIKKFGEGSESFIDQFDELRTNNRKEVRGVDIGKFKDLDELKTFLSGISLSNTEVKKKTKGGEFVNIPGAEIVFENDNWYVYHVKTHEASKRLANIGSSDGGCVGKWCVSANSPTHWNQYENRDITLYFLIRKDTTSKLVVNVYTKEQSDKIKNRGELSGEKYFEVNELLAEMWDEQDNNISKQANGVLSELKIPTSLFVSVVAPFDGYKFRNKKFEKKLVDGVLVFDNLDVSEMELKSLKELPWVQEGLEYKVGYFNCSNNNLTTLEGGPSSVDGSFNCRDNRIRKLEGGPKTVGGDFNCSENRLRTLEGGPSSVDGSFNCYDNDLTSLKGSPSSVVGYFNCSVNNLTTLEGGPKTVGGNFDCSNNNLTTLEGGPSSVGGSFNCYDNRLKLTREQVREVINVDGNVYV